MKHAILCAFCFSVLLCRAQNAPEYIWTNDQNMAEIRRLEHEQNSIYVHYEQNKQGDYQFLCDNNSYSDYTVEVSFTELVNLQADMQLPARITVSPGRNKSLFVLRKNGFGGSGTHFSYRYRSYKGCVSAKPDTGFTYLLPVAPGHDTKIVELKSLAQQYGKEAPPEDWYCLSLGVRSGDTIYAARCGRVTSTREQATLRDSNYTYSAGDNYIEIEHNDCTFGKYSVFRNDGIFVHPGDWVEAGQPIGIAGGEKYASGPQVRFCVFYSHEGAGQTRTWAYVPLYFWTKDSGKMRLANRSTYIADHPADVVTREMSKKEARKWKDKHGVK